MPWRRNPKLIEKGYFHIYNRGVEKRVIYISDEDYSVFSRLISFYIYGARKRNGSEVGGKYKNKIAILCYCLMPNHYHLLLKQIVEGSVSNFMHALGTSYALYFNRKYERVGPLFQNRFNSKIVEGDSSLLNISRYIHRNPDPMEKLKIKLASYNWSSYSDYLGYKKQLFVSTEDILGVYSIEKARAMYKEFVEDAGYRFEKSPAYV